MEPHSIEYLDWALAGPRPEDRYRLAASGMPDVSAEEVAELMREAGSRIADWRVAERGFAAKVAEVFGLTSDHVLPVLGTSMALYVACAASARAGDEVLVEHPTYEPLRRVPEALGLSIRRFSRSATRAFAIDVDALESEITPRTRLVLLSNPHNPSGALLDAPTVHALADLSNRRKVRILFDEVYLWFAPDGASAAALGDFCLTVSSLTKVFGLSCLRAGWITGPPALIARGERLLSYVIGSHPSPTLAAAEVALARRASYFERARSAAARGIEIARSHLAGRDDIDWLEPSGTLFSFPRVKRPGFRSSVFAPRLREETGTVVVPGSFFEAEDSVRIGIGANPDHFASGLAALTGAIDRMEEAPSSSFISPS